MFRLVRAVAIRSVVALGTATLLLMSTAAEIVADMGRQEGAAVGRIALAASTIAVLVWAAWPWRRVYGRLPRFFVATWVVAIGAGGLLLAVDPEHFAAVVVAAALLLSSYAVLAAETLLTRPRRLPPGAPWPPTSPGMRNRSSAPPGRR